MATDGRIICFGSAASAAEFFALEKQFKTSDGSNVNGKDGDERKDRTSERRKEKKSVFERLGEKPKKLVQRTNQPQRKRCRKANVLLPEWNNFSLMGDSIMVRIAKALDAPLLNSSACRGGLNTVTLLNIIRKMESAPKKAIILIGINDVTQGVSKDAIIENLHQILRILRSKGTEDIILIELLPVLNLRSPLMAKKLKQINQSIAQMGGGIVTVLEMFNHFMKRTKQGEAPNSNLFERNNSSQTTVHPGAAGIGLIINKLKELLSLQ